MSTHDDDHHVNAEARHLEALQMRLLKNRMGGYQDGVPDRTPAEEEARMVALAMRKDGLAIVADALGESLTHEDAVRLAQFVYDAASEGLDGDHCSIGRIVLAAIRKAALAYAERRGL